MSQKAVLPQLLDQKISSALVIVEDDGLVKLHGLKKVDHLLHLDLAQRFGALGSDVDTQLHQIVQIEALGLSAAGPSFSLGVGGVSSLLKDLVDSLFVEVAVVVDLDCGVELSAEFEQVPF